MIKALLRSLLVLLMLLMGLFAFILTPMGLRLGIDFGSKLLPGKLTISKISGVIVGPMTLEKIAYADQDETITVSKLHLNWSPIYLLKGQVRLRSLIIESPRIMIHEKSEAPWDMKKIESTIHTVITTAQDKALPLHIVIDQMHVINLEYLDLLKKTHVKIPSISMESDFSSKRWNFLCNLDMEKPTLLHLQLSVSGTPFDYHIHSRFTGKNTEWELTGSGNQQQLTLSTEKTKLLNGSLVIQGHFDWAQENAWTGHLKTQLHIPSAQAQISFSHHAQWNIEWQAQFHALSDLIPNATGDITSQGKINGQLSNPHFDITLHSQLRAHHIPLRETTLHLFGNFTHHTAIGSFLLHQNHIQLQLTGHYNDDQKKWAGTLNQFNLSVARIKTFYLQKKVAITANPDTLDITPFCLTSDGHSRVCVSGQLHHSIITASADIHIINFNWLKNWVRDAAIQGKLLGHFQINGNIKKPIVSGNVNLAHGVIALKKLNVTLDNIKGSVTSQHGHIHFELQAFSQKKPITVTGKIDFSEPSIEAHITANNILAMNTSEYVAYLSSDLHLLIKDKTISLTGNLTIPKANIHPYDYYSTTDLPEQDIVYIHNNKQAQSKWETNFNVLLKIGNQFHVDTDDDIHLSVSGIDATLGGTLQLTQQNSKDIFGTGNIYVKKGTYTVFGQTLTITPNSYVAYARDLLSDPALSIKATKTINSVQSMAGVPEFDRTKLIVGVELEGNAKKPRITFFSNRSSLSQADILSYLLLGYSSSSEAGNTDFLLRALSAVNLTSQGIFGKQNLALQIQQGLGLSELGVESEDTIGAMGNPLSRQSSFVIGKRITKHIAIRYSVGLPPNPINVFAVRYMFNKNWSVQGDSNSLGNGGDILYTVDKN